MEQETTLTLTDKDISSESGVNTYLIETADDMSMEWFENVNLLELLRTSTPDELVKRKLLIKCLHSAKLKLRGKSGIEENVVFKLPKELINYEIAN